MLRYSNMSKMRRKPNESHALTWDEASSFPFIFWPTHKPALTILLLPCALPMPASRSPNPHCLLLSSPPSPPPISSHRHHYPLHRNHHFQFRTPFGGAMGVRINVLHCSPQLLLQLLPLQQILLPLSSSSSAIYHFYNTMQYYIMSCTRLLDWRLD